MADEITVKIEFSYSKNGEVSRKETFTPDVSGDSFVYGVQEIGTGSEEAVAELADLGTPGWCFVKNLDGTNFISLGPTGSLGIKLLAGESAVFRLAAALYAQADTGACDLEYIIIEL